MTTVLLLFNCNQHINHSVLTISSTYSIAVINSKALKNTKEYYNSKHPNAELIILKTYKNYDIYYKDTIYMKLKDIFKDSLHLSGRRMYITKKNKLCFGLNNKIKFNLLKKHYISRIKMLV